MRERFAAGEAEGVDLGEKRGLLELEECEPRLFEDRLNLNGLTSTRLVTFALIASLTTKGTTGAAIP